jgi:SnoaL-like domain
MKQTFLYLLYITSLFVFMSCKENADESITAQNIERAKKSFQAFNEHNWELQSSYFSDTCKYLDPSYGDTHVTVNRRDKAAKYAEMESTSPDIKDSITSIFGYDDKVVIQFTSTGTAKTENGDFKWSVPICCVFTYKDGLVVVDETYYNRGK